MFTQPKSSARQRRRASYHHQLCASTLAGKSLPAVTWKALLCIEKHPAHDEAQGHQPPVLWMELRREKGRPWDTVFRLCFVPGFKNALSSTRFRYNTESTLAHFVLWASGEMVDALVLGTSGALRGGSSPFSPNFQRPSLSKPPVTAQTHQ
jgi:hypothetical protein